MGYNNGLTMKDIFRNPKLSCFIPKFEKVSSSTDSEAVVEKWVLEYLRNALKGQITNDGELTVNGKQKAVLRRVCSLKIVLEDFIGNMPTIAKSLKNDTKLYTPFVTIKEFEDAIGTERETEISKIILENITYNPDVVNVSGKHQSRDFITRQNAWIKKVGYKEK